MAEPSLVNSKQIAAIVFTLVMGRSAKNKTTFCILKFHFCSKTLICEILSVAYCIKLIAINTEYFITLVHYLNKKKLLIYFITFSKSVFVDTRVNIIDWVDENKCNS